MVPWPPRHGIAGHLVLGRVADEALRVRKGHVGRRGAIALVVGDDLHSVVPENLGKKLGGPRGVQARSVGANNHRKP